MEYNPFLTISEQGVTLSLDSGSLQDALFQGLDGSPGRLDSMTSAVFLGVEVGTSEDMRMDMSETGCLGVVWIFKLRRRKGCKLKAARRKECKY